MNRAWIEINLKALEHNIKSIKNMIPEQCRIMAVVKANAYGHGDIQIAEYLNQMGIDTFAVATLDEGIRLRKSGIKGYILILGYTHIEYFNDIVYYNLIQTVVDADYAKQLNTFGEKVMVHIKIDTGMHRLGLDFRDMNVIKGLLEFENLDIRGIYSHLCVSDSLSDTDISFTNQQIRCFCQVREFLNEHGYHNIKTHLQSSYGILNYQEIDCNYVRPGIILYGIQSSMNIKTKVSLDLKAVLSIKARIASIHEIDAGESVGYERKFRAVNKRTVATVTIGYADGIPRSLIGQKTIVKGKFAKIIGSICMDQLMIDITNIKSVKQGDIVTLIGQEKGLTVSAEEMAYHDNTITNELLSRLGTRLEKVYCND